MRRLKKKIISSELDAVTLSVDEDLIHGVALTVFEVVMYDVILVEEVAVEHLIDVDKVTLMSG